MSYAIVLECVRQSFDDRLLPDQLAQSLRPVLEI